MTQGLDIPKILNDLPALATEVWLTWDAPNPAPRSDQTRAGKPGSRPPTNLSTWDALRPDTKGLLGRLAMCARMVVEERDYEGHNDQSPTMDWSSICVFLRSTMHWWQPQPWSDDITHELLKIHRQLEVCARVEPPTRYLCDQCGAQAFLQDGNEWMRCTEGHQMPGPAALKRQMAKRDPMTAEAIRDEFGVLPATIWQWKRRGLIAPVGRRGKADLWDAWTVLEVRHREVTGMVSA